MVRPNGKPWLRCNCYVSNTHAEFLLGLRPVCVEMFHICLKRRSLISNEILDKSRAYKFYNPHDHLGIHPRYP